MRGLIVGIALAATVIAASCGGSDESRNRGPSPTNVRQQQEKAKKPTSKPQAERESSSGGFTGAQAKRYEEDHETCSAFAPSKVASDLGLSPNSSPVRIAEAYADGYQPTFHQAAFEGCLEGMLGE